MSLSILLLISAVILLLAYRIYGKYVYNKFGLSDARKAPSHTHRDGIDYEPSKPIVVLGHHFASIAGAGPIVGPIIAVTFGWIPAVIWILVGGIFFGAVHDLGSMAASLRTEGKSIGVIIRNQIGVNELPCVGKHHGTKAYFCVFLPKELHKDGRSEDFHLEIGSAYASLQHGEIWSTHSGKLGKEKQIAEVIRLNKFL